MAASGNSGPNGEWWSTTPEFWARVAHPIVAFQIWYAGGSRFCGLPGDWSRAPRDGVEVLVVYHPEDAPMERVIVAGRDEYTLPGQPGSKLGLLIADEAFYSLYASALADEWRP